MQAVDDVQDTPPSSVPPSQPPLLVFGVVCTVHVVPFHRSASGLKLLSLRVVASPVAVHCARPVQDTPSSTAPLKPRLAAVAAMPACGLIARIPAVVARPQGANRRRAGLFSRAAALLAGVPLAAVEPAAPAARAAGDAAAGPAAIIAPARTVATIPAPNAGTAARRDFRRRLTRHLVPLCGAGAPSPLAAPLLATRLPACPAMPSSVGSGPPATTANTSKTPKPGRRLAAVRTVFRSRLRLPVTAVVRGPVRSSRNVIRVQFRPLAGGGPGGWRRRGRSRSRDGSGRW